MRRPWSGIKKRIYNRDNPKKCEYLKISNDFMLLNENLPLGVPLYAVGQVLFVLHYFLRSIYF